MTAIAKRILEWAFKRVFQVTSMAGYAVAIWTYLGWDNIEVAAPLVENLLKALLAILLFVINERPWIKKVTG